MPCGSALASFIFGYLGRFAARLWASLWARLCGRLWVRLRVGFREGRRADLRVDLRVARRAGFSAILRVGRGVCVARPACEGLPSRQNCLTSRTILPIGLFLRLAFHCGEVAQLGEHRLRKAGVEGSNPFFSTTISRGYLITGNPFFYGENHPHMV